MKAVMSVTGINQEASGPSYSVPGLCCGLMANGVNVELHKIGNQRCNDFPFKVKGYSAHRWPWRTIWRSPEMLIGLRTACADADILHSNGLWTMPTVYPGWVKRGSLKLILSPRGSFAQWALTHGKIKKKVFDCLLQRKVCRSVDMWHATSEKEYLEIRSQGYRQPVAIIPIGMEIPKLNVESSHKSDASNARSTRRVAFFGRLHKIKAIDNLIFSWGEIATTYPNWELAIAGPDCGVRNELERLVVEHNIPRVSFVGELNGQAKYDFLSESDIYVLPSHTENFGITVAEALACGTPVIASQGTPWNGLEIVKAGIWVPIGVQPLVEALKEMMSMDDDSRMRMGTRGREWIARDFTWEGIGLKMKLSYEWLLGRGEKPDCVKVD